MYTKTQSVTTEYNINKLNFDLWFMYYYRRHQICKKELPEYIIKKYDNVYKLWNYTIYNFYTNEQYELRENIIDNKLQGEYYIFDFYSYQSKKHILSFVSNFDIYTRFGTALFVNRKINKPIKHIYFLVNDQLIRFKNATPLTSFYSFELYFVANIPFIYKSTKHKCLVYNIFDPKFIRIPFELQQDEITSNKFIMYNGKKKLYMYLNPFDFKLYLQYKANSCLVNQCIPLNVLV